MTAISTIRVYYNPALFGTRPDAREAEIPPGPNNPVGVMGSPSTEHSAFTAAENVERGQDAVACLRADDNWTSCGCACDAGTKVILHDETKRLREDVLAPGWRWVIVAGGGSRGSFSRGRASAPMD